MASIARALDLGEAANAPALVAAVKAKLAGVRLAGEQISTLLRRVGELETVNAEHAWQEFLAGPAAGKVTPAMTETVKSIFMGDRQQAETLVAGLPKLAGSASVFAGDRSAGGRIIQGEGDSETTWKAAYAKSPELQQEFGQVESFVAFKRHESAGHVNILGTART